MRHRILPLAVLALFMFHVNRAEAGPIQWTIASGGNDHYYDLVVTGGQISWSDANVAGNGMSFLGAPGHLATITSAGESAFLQSHFASQIGDPNTGVAGVFGWVGLTDHVAEGNFQWVTGEPLTFTDWAPGEPNNLGNEDFTAIWRRDFGSGPLWSWNDFNNVGNAGTTAYFVEFDGPFTPTSVPEPAAIWTLLAGILTITVIRLVQGRGPAIGGTKRDVALLGEQL